ncbi:hypothetical protein CALCODRAFT_528396, partial [Calocera cornea HHB12733]
MFLWVFKGRPPRDYEGTSRRPAADTLRSGTVPAKRRSDDHAHRPSDRSNEESFPPPYSEDLVRTIISEYTDSVSTENLRTVVCASCAEGVRAAASRSMCVEDVDFTVLTNPLLPSHLRPIGYNLCAYSNAILEPAGLSNANECEGNVTLCTPCHSYLRANKKPALALANQFYYAHDHVPSAVQDAFNHSTFVDRRLVARCSTTKICFRYFDNPESRLYRNGFDGMQRYSRGNVLVLPQDTARLHNVLPPPMDDVRDSFVAIFAGHEPPTPEMLRRVQPVKANANTVRTIIAFLLERNKAYTCTTEEFPDGPATFSARNFSTLFPDAEGQCAQSTILPCVEVGHVQLQDPQSAVESDISDRNVFQDAIIEPTDFFVEASGYTTASSSTASYDAMKADALAHCLDRRGTFLVSTSGTRPVQDFRNEYLLTWMFPHLDPFGLGGFDDPRRSPPVSMSRQLAHMLRLADRRYQQDPAFAFVFHNIIQKRQSLREVRFCIPEGRHQQIVENLQTIDPEVLANLAHRLKGNPSAQPKSPEEVIAMRVLRHIQMLRKDVPGSDAYKRCRRNEIRSLVYRYGSPAFFITITPCDVDGLLCALAIDGYKNAEQLRLGTTRQTRFHRAMQVAHHPGIAASVFHDTMLRFRDIILRIGDGPGLFGDCTAWYGMVEAQGRGTLHCHMLVWIDGNPTPTTLRKRLQEDHGFQARMITWLESIIQTELPGDTEVVEEPCGALPMPKLSKESIDPRTAAFPDLRLCGVDWHSAFNAHVKALVERNNWHEHRATCWIHLRAGEERSDEKCRMRMDGTTRKTSEIDPQTGAILLRRLHPRINEYNNVMMFLLQCNMDIQYLGSGEASRAALYYITDYITKSSLKVHAGMTALIYALQKNRDKFAQSPELGPNVQSKSLVNKLLNSMMARQEVSHQQVMSYYVGGGDCYKSDKFAKLHWGFFSYHVAKWEQSMSNNAQSDTDAASLSSDDDAQSDSENMEENDLRWSVKPTLSLTVEEGSVSAGSQLYDYIFRPAASPFTEYCLYDFVRWCEKDIIPAKERCAADSDESPAHRGRPCLPRGHFMHDHPQHSTHWLRQRSGAVVPDISGQSIPRRESGGVRNEAWCRAMLILFQPWRQLADLYNDAHSWLDAFDHTTFDSFHMSVMDNMDVLNDSKE